MKGGLNPPREARKEGYTHLGRLERKYTHLERLPGLYTTLGGYPGVYAPLYAPVCRPSRIPRGVHTHHVHGWTTVLLHG